MNNPKTNSVSEKRKLKGLGKGLETHQLSKTSAEAAAATRTNRDILRTLIAARILRNINAFGTQQISAYLFFS